MFDFISLVVTDRNGWYGFFQKKKKKLFQLALKSSAVLMGFLTFVRDFEPEKEPYLRKLLREREMNWSCQVLLKPTFLPDLNKPSSS